MQDKKLVIEDGDCKRDEYNCINILNSLLSNNDVIAVLGAGTSELSAVVQTYCVSDKVNQISYHASATYLSNEEKYPYHARIIPSDKYKCEAIVSLIRYYKWERFAFIYQNDIFGFSARDDIAEALYKDDVYTKIEVYKQSVNSNIKLPLTESQEEAIDEMLHRIKENGFRVILLYTYYIQAAPILYRASKLGMIGKGWVWISPELVHDIYTTLDEEYRSVVQNAMSGQLGINPYGGDMRKMSDKFIHYSMKHNKEIREMEKMCGTEFSFQVKDLSYAVSYAYDTVYFVANTMDYMVKNGIDIMYKLKYIIVIIKINY